MTTTTKTTKPRKVIVTVASPSTPKPTQHTTTTKKGKAMPTTTTKTKAHKQYRLAVPAERAEIRAFLHRVRDDLPLLTQVAYGAPFQQQQLQDAYRDALAALHQAGILMGLEGEQS